MINTTEFEKVFILFSLKNPHYLDNVDSGFFEIKELDIIAKIIKAYHRKFKQTPSKEQIWMLIQTKDINIEKDFYEKVFERPLEKYDIDWVKSTAEAWIYWKNLDSSLTDTFEYVQTQKINPDNVKDIIRKVKDIINDRNSITFSNDLGLDFFNADHHIISKDSTITTNYQFMDNLIGGYTKKTLIVYVAPPNTGKTLFMGHDAAEYIKAGKNVVYITLEMQGQKIIKRVGSKLLGISVNEYDKKSKDKAFIEERLKSLRNGNLLGLGELRVQEFPTSSATVDDIENYLKNLEQTTGTKYDVVIVDYINILRDIRNPNTEQTYIKIKNISEDLRAFSQRCDIVLITATQTNRTGFDSTELTMGSIAESAALSHTADNVIGIIQTPDMNRERIYWLKLLKVRDGAGKHTKCMFHIDYEFMTLTESNTILNDQEF